MIVQTADRFTICSTAALIDDGDQLRAWAERYVRRDPDIRWILGNYVEADQANNNGHIFPLDELHLAQATLEHKPLNMVHREHYIVGAFAGAQLLTAEGAEITSIPETAYASTQGRSPYVEALAGLWHRRFPEEFFNIKRAHAEGTLFYSMEAVPQEVSCPTCAHRTAFAGLEHDTYCDHMQGAIGPKRLHNPIFCGGAIVIPPVKPGWSRADVTTISKLLAADTDIAERTYQETAAMAPHLAPAQWEAVMAELMAAAAVTMPKGMAMAEGKMPMTTRQDVAMAVKSAGKASNPAAARQRIMRMASKLNCEDVIPSDWKAPAKNAATAKEFSQPKRDKLADKGHAMPDGSFPIENIQDLKNAIQAIGRAKNPAAAKAHIRKRARALGAEDLIPDGW